MRHTLIPLSIAFVFSISVASAGSLPSAEKDFYLASDELINHYRDIPRFHREQNPARSRLTVNNLSSLWGKPTEVSEHRQNLWSSIFLGASTMVFALPNPLLAIGIAAGVTTASVIQTENTLVWEKGDYLIEVNTRAKKGQSFVSSWKWNYKSLDRLVPIMGTDAVSKSYFLVGYGKGSESLFGNSSSYANGQYFLFGHQIQRIKNIRLFFEMGGHWGSPGNATPDDAQWVRIPVNFLMKTPVYANGFSFGSGFGYQFSKEYNSFQLGRNALRGAKSIFGFVEYVFSKRISIGIKNDFQWIENQSSSDKIIVNQLSTYAGVRF